MIFEQTIFPLLASIGTSVFVAHGIVRWRNAGSRNSDPGQSERAEDHRLSSLSSLFHKAPLDLGHGRTEHRPMWGVRLVAPLVALVLLAITDIFLFWNALGIQSPALQSGLLVGLALVLGYVWFVLLFVQRVVYDETRIMKYGFDLREHTRELRALTEIQVPDWRAKLVLGFSEQKALNVPKFLSHREAFILAMENLAQNNMNNGAVPPLPGWQQKRTA